MKQIMKSLTHSYLLVVLMVAALSACRGPEAKNASSSSASIKSTEDEKYAIDKKNSVVTYTGSKAILSLGAHTGYVYLSNGELLMNNGQLVGGTFEIDMNTIADIDHGSENNLVRHFKSADFFDVEKFPVSAFVITAVVPDTESAVAVTGNLTIKGITHAVTFPAQVEVKDEVVQATGSLTIDRTLWGVQYNSGKLGLNVVADEIISDEIAFTIKVVATKSGKATVAATAEVAAASNILLQSKDGGQTWQDISQSLPEAAQPDDFFAGESDIYLRVKSGLYHSKTNLETPVWQKDNALNSRSASIAFSRAGALAFNHKGPVYQKKFGTKNWLPIYKNADKLWVWSIFETSEGAIFLGSNTGFYKSADKGKSWKQVLSEGGASIEVAESDDVLIKTSQKGIMRSTDKGETWNWAISEGGVGIAVESIEGGFAAVSYNTKSQSRRVHLSLDRGATWTAIDEGLPPSPSISSIIQVGNALVCGHPEGIFRSSNMGKTWQVVHPGVDKPSSTFILTGTSTSNNNKKVYKIYRSGSVLYAVARHFGC